MTLAAHSTNDDAGLLREYSEHRSETAFAELVRRHVDLVYSAALRQVGGDAAAQDVTQGVFTELARHAGRLMRHPALTGWLYTTTRRLAAHAVRGETRRQRREQEAHMMQELLREPVSAEPELDWERVRPVLDAAMHDLGETDRLAVLLRHFEQRPLAEVGARLGLGENAARMRADRALDKLRAKLAKRGVTSTSTALAVALAGPAITAAPATLASTITAAALAATVSTTSTFGLLSLMATTKLKLAVTAAVLLGVSVPLVRQQRNVERLRAENSGLRQRLELAEGDAQSALAESRQAADELARLREGQAELWHLRGELARLRNRAVATTAPVAGKKSPATHQFDATTWNAQATVGFQQTLVTAAWAWKDQAAVLLVRPIPGSASGHPSFQLESTIVQAPLDLLERHGLAGESDAPHALSEEAAANLLAALKQDGAELSKTDPTTPGEEGFVLVGFTEDDHDQTMSFKLAPELLADQQVNLAISAERRALSALEQQILREPDASVRQELIKRRDAERNSAGDGG